MASVASAYFHPCFRVFIFSLTKTRFLFTINITSVYVHCWVITRKTGFVWGKNASNVTRPLHLPFLDKRFKTFALSNYYQNCILKESIYIPLKACCQRWFYGLATCLTKSRRDHFYRNWVGSRQSQLISAIFSPKPNEANMLSWNYTFAHSIIRFTHPSTNKTTLLHWVSLLTQGYFWDFATGGRWPPAQISGGHFSSSKGHKLTIFLNKNCKLNTTIFIYTCH